MGSEKSESAAGHSRRRKQPVSDSERERLCTLLHNSLQSVPEQSVAGSGAWRLFPAESAASKQARRGGAADGGGQTWSKSTRSSRRSAPPSVSPPSPGVQPASSKSRPRSKRQSTVSCRLTCQDNLLASQRRQADTSVREFQ